MANKRDRKEHTLDLNVATDLPTWEKAIDNAIDNSFNPTATNDMDIDGFVSAINTRTTSSKYAMSIGSVAGYSDGSSNLFEPIFTHIDEFKAQIDSIDAIKQHKVTPEFLSKIWHVKEEYTKKALSQTTQR